MTGAAVQWLRDGLQIVGSAAETRGDRGDRRRHRGRGLRPGADRPRRAALGPARPRPDHRAHPRHHPRAHRPRDPGGDRVRGARRARDDARRCSALRVDGGAAANDLLCQIQADQIGVPVERPEVVETTGLGAAFLAGLGAGVWDSTDDLRDTWTLDRRFEPATRPGRAPTPPTPAGATPSSARRAGPSLAGLATLVRAPAAGARPRACGSPSRDGRRLGARRGRPRRRRARRRSPRRPTRARRSCRAARRSRPGAGGRAPRASSTAACASSCAAVASAELGLGRGERLLGRGDRLPVGLRVGYDVQVRPRRRLRRPRAGALKPSASGTATARRRRPGRRPVAGQRGDQQPAAHRRARSCSSTIAAVRVASTWSATASVTRVPASSATRARLGGDRGGQLAALPGQRAQLVARHGRLRLAQRRPDGEHLLDLLGLAADQQVDHPRGGRRLAQRLDLRGQRRALELLRPRVARRGELGQRQAVQLVGDLEQLGHAATLGSVGPHVAAPPVHQRLARRPRPPPRRPRRSAAATSRPRPTTPAGRPPRWWRRPAAVPSRCPRRTPSGTARRAPARCRRTPRRGRGATTTAAVRRRGRCARRSSARSLSGSTSSEHPGRLAVRDHQRADGQAGPPSRRHPR